MQRHKWLTGMMTATLVCSLTLAQPLLSLAATSTPPPTVSGAALIPGLQRISGQDRYATAAKIAEQGWPISSNYAILAAGMDQNLVDALTAAPLAKALNAPILLTQGDSLNTYAEAELKRLGVKVVFVTSGAGVIQPAVTDRLETLGIQAISLGGKDRFATSLNLAQTLATVAPFSQLVVATAYSNADALSVAGIAAAQGMPILLTNVNALPQETADYINSLSGLTHTYVVGGPGVVSEAVMNELPQAQRAGGDDRYATNRQILQAFAPELKYGQIYVTNGSDTHLVDALAVAPLAAQTDSPVVMSDEEMPAETLTYVRSNLLPTTITVLGGESVVSSLSLSSLNSALTYEQAGDTEGSADPNNKLVLTDRVNITGDNVTLQNAVEPYSIYVTGNKATLKNLSVAGSIFLDPGADGGVTLDQVSAANIVVMSGGANSISLNNVSANDLINPTNLALNQSGSCSFNLQPATGDAETQPASPQEPAAPPTSTETTQPETPPASGGTPSNPDNPSAPGGTTTPVDTPTLAASSITLQLDNAAYNQTSSGTTSFSVDLSSVPDSARLTGLQFGTNGSAPSITVTSVSTPGVSNWLPSPKTVALSNGAVSITSLLGSVGAGHNGVSLKTLRLMLGGGAMTVEGYLSETGYNNSPNETVTINLGTSASGS